jgi:hypothetical protein
MFFWSWGHGGLYFHPRNTTMNGDRYKTILEDHRIRFMNFYGALLILQEGAPCHASKHIK